MKYKIEILKDGRSNWWRVVCRNGQVLLTSEIYVKAATCKRIAKNFSKATRIPIK